MDINNVERRTIIVVNGQEFVRRVENFTESALARQAYAAENHIEEPFNTPQDVIEFIEEYAD